ncbi:Sulfhydryl oxidase 1 [Capsicum annuum]|nr:Sulfhydryl oxidase 1 [Capsicum annuum]
MMGCIPVDTLMDPNTKLLLGQGEPLNDLVAVCGCCYTHSLQHFHDMCTSVSSPFKKARDYALWLWSAHNKVNERLMKDEESPGTGDPEFPKVIWPPKQLCPSCYLNPGKTSDENSKIDWNKDEVFKFLVSYYGKELVNLYEDVKELQAGGSTQKTVNEELVASTDAVVVPLGAALAIAVASCAFGALACFWRSQQKNRKPRRSWN